MDKAKAEEHRLLTPEYAYLTDLRHQRADGDWKALRKAKAKSALETLARIATVRAAGRTVVSFVQESSRSSRPTLEWPVSSLRPRFGNIYGLESRPPFSKTFFIALQHTLAMFVGIITPPLIVAAGSAAPGRNVVLRERGALRLWHLYHHAGDVRRARWDRAPLGAGHVVHFRGPALAAGAVGGVPLMLGMSILAAPLEIILSFVVGFARRLFAPIVTGTSS